MNGSWWFLWGLLMFTVLTFGLIDHWQGQINDKQDDAIEALQTQVATP